MPCGNFLQYDLETKTSILVKPSLKKKDQNYKHANTEY